MKLKLKVSNKKFDERWSNLTGQNSTFMRKGNSVLEEKIRTKVKFFVTEYSATSAIDEQIDSKYKQGQYTHTNYKIRSTEQ